MSATLKDVAARAGVAKSTVSFVLNGKDHVSEKTKRKVLKAIEELDYTPNEMARNLGRKQNVPSGTNCVAFLTCFYELNAMDPYYGKILNGIYAQARERKYRLLFTGMGKDDKDLPEEIDKNIIDGLIISGRPTKKILEQIKKSNLPFVLASFELSEVNCDTVRADNIKGIVEGINYLHEMGHEDIAFISGDLGHPDTLEKLRGFKIAMQELSLDFENKIVMSDYTAAGGVYGLEELLKRNVKFSAIMTGNDGIALGVYEKAAELGIKVPDDLSVLGFDGIELGAHASPPLSTIEVDLEGIGSMAFRHLLNIMDGGSNPVTVRVSTKLLKRKSIKNGL